MDEIEEKVWTYESSAVAQKRKQFLLQEINKYNEALFSNSPLPYSDEELDEMQEEYYYLDNHIALTDEEKVAKLDNKNVDIVDGEKIAKVGFWDKISIIQVLWMVIGTLLSMELLTYVLGNVFYSSFCNMLFSSFYKNEFNYISTLPINYFGYWLLTVGSFAIFPLLMVALILLFFFIYKNKSPEARKLAFVLLIVQLSLLVVSFIILYFTYISPKIMKVDWDSEYHIAYKYYLWLVKKGYINA